MSTLETLAASKYLSLTTFRADGTPVATPVWLVRDGGSLLVITERSSGKAKRIARNPDVRVAPCDMRGRLRGEAVPATAELLDAHGTATAQSLVTRRYGRLGRFFAWRSRRSTGSAEGGSVGIRVRLPDQG